jgi:uncharacterized RDD family membrane protein YckC
VTGTPQSCAGLGIRVVAFVLDYIVIALYLVVTTVMSWAINTASPTIPKVLFGNPLSGELTGFFAITLPVTLYFALLESSPWQASWGKRRQRLQVIRTTGERLTRPRAMGRTLLKFIPWELAHACIWQVSFAGSEPSPWITTGFVMVWLLVGANALSLSMTKTHQTLYDWLAKTYVVTT